jgi:hypothetical protein
MRALAAVALLALAAPAAAQTEAQLKAFFEGKRVAVMIDMPANEAGIDVRPGLAPPIDFSVYGSRVKGFGVALAEGQQSIVTKVKVKKDLIEFQLGGGGADTPSDRHQTYIQKSNRENDLENEKKRTTDQNRKRQIDRELDDLRRDRQREEEAARALDAIANAAERDQQRQQALLGGSRFNIRYKPAVPPDALTPQGIMAALSEYVDFTGLPGAPVPHVTTHETFGGRALAKATSAPSVGAGAGVAGLRKGLSREDVEELLGAAVRETKKAEGSLTTVRAVFESGDHVVEATFLDGTLVKYTISSR